jgi:hypothetical protein
MLGSKGKMRLLPAAATFAAFTVLTASSEVDAQWFPPMGAASPGEIVQRLRAEGFVLIGPLRRRDTIYLADVNAGPDGRERLVIDAWSGEVLQRFMTRPRSWRPGPGAGYPVERGEFDSPPPLGPPPMRDFYVGPGGNFAYGGPPDARIPDAVGPINPHEAAPRTRVKPKPAAHQKSPETKPATATAPARPQPAEPQPASANASVKDTSGTAPPSAAAPTGAPAPTSEASQQPNAPVKPDASPTASPPSPTPEQPKEPSPAQAAPAAVQTQARDERAAAPPQAPSSAPAAPAAKPADKPKANDVPVNPLE